MIAIIRMRSSWQEHSLRGAGGSERGILVDSQGRCDGGTGFHP